MSAAEGTIGDVYNGRLAFEVDRVDLANVPPTRTKLMLNLGNPDRAFAAAAIPNDGVGLARIEFIIPNQIGVHPMAIAMYPYLEDENTVESARLLVGDEGPGTFSFACLRRASERSRQHSTRNR